MRLLGILCEGLGSFHDEQNVCNISLFFQGLSQSEWNSTKIPVNDSMLRWPGPAQHNRTVWIHSEADLNIERR